MKVGLFTDVYPPQIGGIEVVIVHIERMLRERGHDAHVFAPAYPEYRADGPHVHRLPSVRVPRSRNLRVVHSWSRAARRAAQDLDIVHSHTCYTAGRMGASIARARGIPHVYTYHTLFQKYRQTLAPGLPKAVLDAWLRSFLRSCDLIVAPSRDAKDEVEGCGVSVPVQVLPFGLDAADFDRPPLWDPRSELGIAERHLLLFVGRLAQEKNVGFVLRAFRILLGKRQDVRLVIVGDGPCLRDLQKQARELGIESRTTFCGFMPRERALDLNRQADLFVFGSKTETQGLVVLEAMMAGTPPVAVDAPGVRDMVRSGTDGLLVPEDDQVFAACCDDLLADGERRRTLGEAARTRARGYTAQASVDELIRWYRDLLGERSPAGVTAGP